MNATEFLKQKGIFDRVVNTEDLTEYWKSISQLMEEYAQDRAKDVQTSTSTENVADFKAILPSERDMLNKISDAKPFQKNETPEFIEGYSLGYHHCYNWIKRITSLF